MGELFECPLLLIGILIGFGGFSFFPASLSRSFTHSFSSQRSFNRRVAVQENMTLFADNFIKSSPVLVDLDNDGDNEIIIGDYDGELHAWTYPGNSVPGWENRLFCGGPIFSSPAVADIDNDNQYEIALEVG
ncbi:MAG: FG-GAP repeat domain-containing protein [Candidatus Hodarchaeota archaeon]